MKKYLVLLLFCWATSGIAAALHVQAKAQFAIYAVENRSEHFGKLNDLGIGATEHASLKKSLIIPFCSWLRFKKEILYNEPYMPSNALIIEIDGVQYGIWQDEQGIWYARKFVAGSCSREECLPKKIFSTTSVSLAEVEKAIKLLLIIEHNCSLRICKISR